MATPQPAVFRSASRRAGRRAPRYPSGDRLAARRRARFHRHESEVENLRVAFRRHMMVSGVRPPWTTSAACASASASAICVARSTARRMLSGRPAITRFKRLARHELEDEKQAAVLVADFVQRRDVRVRQHARRRARPRAARRPRAIRLKLRAGSLIATVRPRRVSRARYTSPSRAGADPLEDLVVAEAVHHLRDDYTDTSAEAGRYGSCR